MPEEPLIDPPEHHVRRRRAKRFLRFTPRRAVFHRYPIVGRFADAARRRAYLWSFKPEHVRPALYAGSVLALWPVMGLQLPLALLLSIGLRANFMVAGALQFITNPLTAAPVYYLTYQVGKAVLRFAGWLLGSEAAAAAEGLSEPVPADVGELATWEALPADTGWISGLGGTVSAWLVGGTVCGLVLGLILDVLFRQGFSLRKPVSRDAAPDRSA